MADLVQKLRNKALNWYIIVLVLVSAVLYFAEAQFSLVELRLWPFPCLLLAARPCLQHPARREALPGLPDPEMESQTAAFSFCLRPGILLWERQVSIHDQSSLCPRDHPTHSHGYVSLRASISSLWQILQNWTRSNSVGFWRCLSKTCYG